ncbi:hypothetical protein HanRHA438_Chr10g0443001 [Helianthus annuus]|nr:hypothetical protein HanRHA438_Chr10g0443001 [Helianthus annuus]
MICTVSAEVDEEFAVVAAVNACTGAGSGTDLLTKNSWSARRPGSSLNTTVNCLAKRFCLTPLYSSRRPAATSITIYLLAMGWPILARALAYSCALDS